MCIHFNLYVFLSQKTNLLKIAKAIRLYWIPNWKQVKMEFVLALNQLKMFYLSLRLILLSKNVSTAYDKNNLNPIVCS